MIRRRADWRIAAAIACCSMVALSPPLAAGGSAPTHSPPSATVEDVGRSVSGEQFEALVRAAASDPRALAELRRVHLVDGARVDVSLALAGSSPTATAQRLRALAAVVGRRGPPSSSVSSGPAARREAAKILDGRKYRASRVPRPLQGALSWLGDRLEPVFGPVARALGRIAGSVAGAIAIVLALLGLTIAVARHLIRSRSRAAIRRPLGDGLVPAGADPAELDRSATEAEASGDHRRAVRLRYQAGLLRLQRAGRIDLRPDTTPSAIAAQVGSRDLDQLTEDFEEIVYGDRSAGPADGASAKARWSAVLTAEAGRR